MSYDGNYGRSYDSGFDCSHPTTYGTRICNDGEIKRFEQEHEKQQESLGTLFPLPLPTVKDPFEIPSWCPLENVNEGA